MGDLIGGLLAAIFGDRLLRWRSSRHAAEGDYDCALRSDASRGWEHGRARVSPGLVQFRRISLGRAKGEERVIEVTWVAADGRRPTGPESWGLSPRATIYRMTTSEGPLDLAVVAPSPEDAVRSLRPLA